MIYNKHLDKIAIITKDSKITYGEFFGKVNSFSQLFEGKKNTRIAICSENRPEWIYAFYAAWLNECTVVTLDFMSSVDDISYVLNDSQPELLFLSAETEKKLSKIKEKLDYNPKVVNFDLLDLKPTTPEKFWEGPTNIDKTAVIIYTSGTTGSPKGVMLSYRNLLANIKSVSEDVIIFTPERQVLMLLPLHHIFPLAGSMMVPLKVGGTIVMSPSMQSSDILETLKNNRVNIMIGVPRLYELMYRGIKAKIDASAVGRILLKVVLTLKSRKLARKIFKKVHVSFGGSLQFMVAGGAALNTEVGNFFQLIGIDVLEGFGMTEAAPMITFTRPGAVRIGSPGQVLPGLKLEIREGEIVAKGPNVMQGYFNRPEETAEVIIDGWLHTGDLGRIDKDGYLYITGRKKEIIILSNGKNVNPVEVENKLVLSSPAIKEAAVFLHNELLHAVIHANYGFLTENGVQNPEQYFRESVIPQFNAELTSYKRIMQFSLTKEDIPRTRLGKIQRFKLNEFIEKPIREKGNIVHPDNDEYRSVKSYIESQVDMDVLPHHHIEFDIAMDSLGKMGLIDHVDKTFGVKIEEQHLLSFPSVKHLSEYITQNMKWFKEETSNWAETLKERVELKLPKSWPTQNIFKNMAKGFFKVYFRFHAEGATNIPDGACIITPNHQSFFDGLFVASFIRWRTMRKTYFYAKQKHVNNAFLRFLASHNNVIVMDINKDLKDSILKLAEVLRSGKKVIIFPEGTRSQSSEIGEFKKTFAILSKELNVPVVPVAICGANKALPKKSWFPRPFAKVNVTFFEPVYPENYTVESLVEHVQQTISTKVKCS
jgi:long-chain acyl-CoA synthetase